jgi:hypothetical protein
MTTAELYQLITRPDTVSAATLPELRQIIADYPCFHAARLLYLKNMAVIEDIRLKKELKTMAVHIPDRIQLFKLLEGDRYMKPPGLPAGDAREKDRKFSLIEQFLLTTADREQPAADTLTLENPLSTDYLHAIPAPNPASPPDVKLQRQELIDSFLENSSDRAGTRLAPPRQDIADDADDSDKEPLNDSYFTETLARVYIKQKRYDKALEIIKQLSLKYPEKNIYFADQIRFLEKLIIHTKL